MQELFAWDFNNQNQNISPETKEVISSQANLDQIIKKSAPAWPIDKINKIDLAILRLATYELLQDQTPTKVVVDEAVELAKTYGSESSSSFVNGVLATIIAEQEAERLILEREASRV